MPTPIRAVRATATARHTPASKGGVPLPLALAYRRAGLAPPTVTDISPEEIPLPYRSLLVHEGAMTLTLEDYFGGRLILRVLSTFTSGAWYCRRVLLVHKGSGRPVEMGGARLNAATHTAHR